MTTQNKKQPAFTDTDRMTFGKYKGQPLADVPASYLLWLFRETELKPYARNETPDQLALLKPWVIEKIKLANYIWNCQDDIEEETGETIV